MTRGRGPGYSAWPAMACAAVAILLFVPTIGYGYVYDDHRFVEANAALSDPAIIWRAFAEPATQAADGTHAGLWRPLRTLSFALDRLVFGGGAWAGHLVNVLLHGAATALLARLLQSVGIGAIATAIAALLYAVHPVQVECVAWISSRGDLLAAVLVWAALLRQRPGRTWDAWLLGAAALLAKEQAIVWPAFAFLVARARGADVATAARRCIVPGAIVLAFLALRHAVLTEPFQEGGLGEGAIGIATLGRMLAHQAWFTALPLDGVFDWQMTAAAGGPARAVLGIVALAALAALAWRATRLPAAWFLAALVPTLFIQLLIPLNIRVADRFLLFALPAVALLGGRLLTRCPRAWPAAALAVACLAGLTLQAQPAWASDTALWTRTSDRLPDHWRARSWLGVTQLQAGDVDAAVTSLERATELAPDDGKTRFRLAEALEAQAARTEGAAVVDATLRARDEYAAAVNRFARGRQENRALLEPIAQLRAVDLTLAMGNTRSVAAVLTAWLDRGPPQIPPAGAALWNRDLTRLIGHVEQHLDPELELPLAPHLREWLVRP